MRLTVLALLLTVSCTTAATNFDDFAIAIEIREAQRLLKLSRFRDAERVLIPVHSQLSSAGNHRPDRYGMVLEMLAKSMSEQGRKTKVIDLLQEQHELITAYYHEDGYAHASSLARLAEAYYRSDQRDKAISLVSDAITIFEALRPAPKKPLKIAQKNLAQYRIAPFSTSALPLDLSDFYTRCETITTPMHADQLDTLMQHYVEVGTDYQPNRMWKAYYNALIEREVSEQEHDGKWRLFIPDSSQPMRNITCLVQEAESVVINAEAEFD